MKIEIAELMNQDGKMFSWATKVNNKLELSTEEKEISQVVDAWAKEIGNKGQDPDGEIAEFVRRTVEPEVYDAADELLSLMFNRGSVGEFDTILTNKTPKNTLKAYKAAKGGTVDKSFIDWESIAPSTFHTQVETEVSYEDLRKGGYKTIATLTQFALEALRNDMVANVFIKLDTAIVGSDQVIAISGQTLDKTSMDKLSLYVLDRVANGDEPLAFGLSTYAQAIANMSGYTTYMSDNMKDEFNRYGLVKLYNGLKIAGISSAKKTADGQTLCPANRVFGVAGKIGNLDQRGEIRVYETLDNKREVVELKITGFEYDITFTDVTKVAKITLS